MPKTKKNKKNKIKKKVYKKRVKAGQVSKNAPEQNNISRITKSYDQKVEIVKIKKQATEKKNF